MLSLSRLSYFGRNSATHAACFSIFSFEEISFPSRIYSARSSSSSFSLAGRTASPIDEKAFEDYKHICKIGGTLPFRKIVKEAGLKVPFESGCLKETVQLVREWFDKADDSQF